jgi:hypothetical protein
MGLDGQRVRDGIREMMLSGKKGERCVDSIQPSAFPCRSDLLFVQVFRTWAGPARSRLSRYVGSPQKAKVGWEGDGDGARRGFVRCSLHVVAVVDFPCVRAGFFLSIISSYVALRTTSVSASFTFVSRTTYSCRR